jgi:hypothetical protein
MSQIYFGAEKKIRMRELFDGRLEAHGVREITDYPGRSEKRRFLTDRDGNTLMVCGSDDVSFCLGKEPTAYGIVDAIRRVFDTRIFDGDHWIAVYRPTGPIRLIELIDDRLERNDLEHGPITVEEVRHLPDGTPFSASLVGSQGLLWVHAGDDGTVEYADAYEVPDQNCGVYFLEDIEKMFDIEFKIEREEVRNWSTRPLNKYGTRWRAELWHRLPETAEETAVWEKMHGVSLPQWLENQAIRERVADDEAQDVDVVGEELEMLEKDEAPCEK